MIVDVPMPARSCPACGHKHETAWDPQGRELKPSEGDWSICFNCGELMRFGPQLSLRIATKADVVGAPVETKLDLIFAAKAVQALKLHRRLN